MATFSISTGTDDGHADSVGGSYSNTSTYVGMGRYSSGTLFYGFFRFDNVTIPAGSTITAAKITFYAANADSSETYLIVKLIDADDPTAPTDNTDYFSRSKTSGVAWTPDAWTTGTAYDTPELNTICQSVIDRAGWASGNALCFVVENNYTWEDSNYHRRRAASYDNTSYTEPVLTITYTAGGSTTTIKKFLGVAQASVKKISPVAIASVKKAAGVANA